MLDEIPQERESGTEADVLYPDWPEEGEVNFVDVSLKYRPPTTETVLRNLSFKVEPGTKIGVVGRTGAGKSTICLSLSRIVELFGGKIEIDGVDIAKIDLNKLRQKVTVIPQDPTLFTGSLKFNLDPFGKESEDRIEQLLKKAGLQDLLTREPDSIEEKHDYYEKLGVKESDILDKEEKGENSGRGIYFRITENGENLSTGEKQLVSICRAILRKNRVVVLDEATANIDVVTEKKILQLLSEEFG